MVKIYRTKKGRLYIKIRGRKVYITRKHRRKARKRKPRKPRTQKKLTMNKATAIIKQYIGSMNSSEPEPVKNTMEEDRHFTVLNAISKLNQQRSGRAPPREPSPIVSELEAPDNYNDDYTPANRIPLPNQ